MIPYLPFVSDPRQWTESHVAHWIQWATKEFSLEGIGIGQFRMKGKDICAMGKDAFQARTPAFVGDILWEHLEILQRGRSPARQTRSFFLCVSGNICEIIGNYGNHAPCNACHQIKSVVKEQVCVLFLFLPT